MSDNHYGDFQYGTSHVYGASSVGELEALAWAIEVDWDGDGAFDGTNEADHLIAAPRIVRGRRTMLRPSGQGFEPVRTGTATFTLSNHDGKYDAWNTASPLYPNVDAGKDVRIRVLDQFTGTIYTRFYGIIQDIDPVGYGADAKVIIRCDDAFRVLRDTQTIAQRPYTDGTLAPAGIDECMTVLLNNMQFPARWGRNIDNSNYGVRYWFANGDRSVATELEDLALSFFGYLFIANDGKIRFIDKGNNTTSVETISQSEMLKEIGNPQPWSIRRNVVKIRFHVRKRADDVFVWQPLDTDPVIGSGETVSYLVEYTHDGYPAYLEDFKKLFHFVKVQGVREPGVNYNVSVTVTDYGTRAFISATNNEAFPLYFFPADVVAIPSDGDATYIRGDITWTEKNETISNPRNPSSVENQRSLVLDSEWHQNKSQAFDFVDNYQAFISLLHKTPIVQLENRFALQFTPELFDAITVDIAYLGISSEDFRVGAIEEEPIGETTQAVRTTFYLEPFLTRTAGTSVWGTGKWGTAKWSW